MVKDFIDANGQVQNSWLIIDRCQVIDTPRYGEVRVLPMAHSLGAGSVSIFV
jgi:hypothetical protein